MAENFHFCIVGAGPSGISLALSLADRGFLVALLEAGGTTADGAVENQSAEDHDPPWHGALERVTLRALGGNFHLWGGRCVPIDRRDLAPSLATDGTPVDWPLPFAEVDRFMRPAADLLDCDGEFTTTPLPQIDPRGVIDVTGLEQWSPVVPVRERLCKRASAHPRIVLMSATNAIGLQTAEDGAGQLRVAGITVRAGGEERTIAAEQFVLAAGAIETTRLLLLEQRDRPQLFNGPTGPLGRYYMGHLTGVISSVTFPDAALRREFDFHSTPKGRAIRRRFAIDPDVAAANDIANIVFWVENLPRANPMHRSALRSLRYLTTREDRDALREDKALSAAHVRNLARDPAGSARLAMSMLLGRQANPHAELGPLIPSRGGHYALRYHAEHLPSPENRITLGDTFDRDGVTRVRIRLRFGQRDVGSIIDAHETLATALNGGGQIGMHFMVDRDQRHEEILMQARDGFHQIGTTRMSRNDREGVVDPDLKVHWYRNHFIASSSVFPTSGQCNPTLTLIALTLRLAKHLEQRMTQADGTGEEVALVADPASCGCRNLAKKA